MYILHTSTSIKILLLFFLVAGCMGKPKRVQMQGRYIAISGGINLWIETYGDKANEACIFISGAGANASFWSERLCTQLVNDGFFVIKYDHRDFGYSTKIDFVQNPFDVMDLTRDAFALLDSFGIEKAHVVGHSMGGFIVQLMAIHFPERVISITSASSSTSSPEVPPPPDRTWEIFMQYQPINDYEKDLEGFMQVWKYLNGTAEFDEKLAIEYTRNLYKRQEVIGALGESHVKAQANLTNRSELLKNISIPALILHGEEDYLVDKSGGIQTAECIPDSKSVLIPEMGHLLFNEEILARFENEILSFLVHHKSKKNYEK